MEINVSPPIKKQLTQEWYDDLALNLMENYQLKRENEIYNFSEIEIYASFNSDDLFCHCHKKQLGNTFINPSVFYHHYSGADVVGGNQELLFYCGILIRGIQKDDKWIYGPGRVSYPSFNKFKAVDLELVRRDSSQTYDFVKSHLRATEITADKIFKLPRYNLSLLTLHKELTNNNVSIIDHYKLEVRYIRLPNNFLKRSKKDLPEDYASIIRKYL